MKPGAGLLRAAVLAGLLLGAAATQAAAPSEDLIRARALTDVRQFPEALHIFDRLVEENPTNSDLAIERARVLGFADWNAQSATAYAIVARNFPERRKDIVESWAWQTLWSDDPKAAVPLFQEVVAHQPANTPARMGLAQSMLWAGQSRAAANQYAALLPTSDERVALQAARAYYWAGFPELAAPVIATSSLPEAQWLRDYRIRRELRPYLSAAVDYSNDSDDLDTLAGTVAAGWRRPGSDTLELSLRTVSLEGPDTSREPPGRHSIDGQQAIFSWSGRKGSPDSPTVFWPMIAVGVRDYSGWTTLAWKARLRFTPADDVTVSAFAGNGVIETIGAVRNEIDYTELTGSVEFRPTPRWLAAASVTQLDYARDNGRSQMTVRGEYLLKPKQQLRVGAEVLHFDNDRPTGPDYPNLGYWNPDRYTEERLYVAVGGDRGKWAYDARASAGFFQEKDGWGNTYSDPLFAAEGTVAYDFSPSLQLRMYAGGSRSGAGIGNGGEGYYRSYAGVSLVGYFK